MVELMAECGLKNMSNDVERCLSLCVEERMCGLISNVIRLSKQRVDMEKPRHKTIITSDVRQQNMAINCKAREEWEKKQAETEKSQKLTESESSTGVDAKERDESRGKSTRVNKEDDDKMRMTAANVAVRAATGVGDITSRWQLMIEAKQKQGGSDTSSGPQTNKDMGRKPLGTSTRNRRENQDSEKQDPAVALTIPGKLVIVLAKVVKACWFLFDFDVHKSQEKSVGSYDFDKLLELISTIRKVGRNQVVVPQVAQSISVKDVIGVLEREPQMLKFTLLYRIYQKVSANTVS